ncbi:MAG: DUF6298 domain-containing protein [Gemmatimonadota bacterium]|nr:DUF6298 domain-containing protein [Gemmatimonadota bacterium]
MRSFNFITLPVLLVMLATSPAPGSTLDGETDPRVLTPVNGWYVQGDRVIWGYAQHNGWWRPGQRPNITRNAGIDIRPNRTEDLEKLTDNMLLWGYPGFEHNYGLWYDRRRDKHDNPRREDADVVGPFFEQPWMRSGEGRAWDGLSKYDLTRFNPWYFGRLKEFAAICDKKGTLLFHNFYMQHTLLETRAHWVDFPWREVNCIQSTMMPDSLPLANAFYDTTNTVRRKLHRLYIRKCLDELGGFRNVIHLVSEEYTGPAHFIRFWLNVVAEWEQENGRRVHLALGATKDVQDELLADPALAARFGTIDLRYWCYKADGSLFAPPGGKEVPGRYSLGTEASKTTPWQIYRQVRETRDSYPDKGIIHCFNASRKQTWAFLTAGGSAVIRYLEYPGSADPPEYIAPEHAYIVKPAYDFLNGYLSQDLPRMKPLDASLDNPRRNWCLAEPGKNYLCYLSEGGGLSLDLRGETGIFRAMWLDPRTGRLFPAAGGNVEAGRIVEFSAPDTTDWALWLTSHR